MRYLKAITVNKERTGSLVEGIWVATGGTGRRSTLRDLLIIRDSSSDFLCFDKRDDLIDALYDKATGRFAPVDDPQETELQDT